MDEENKLKDLPDLSMFSSAYSPELEAAYKKINELCQILREKKII